MSLNLNCGKKRGYEVRPHWGEAACPPVVDQKDANSGLFDEDFLWKSIKMAVSEYVNRGPSSAPSSKTV